MPTRVFLAHGDSTLRTSLAAWLFGSGYEVVEAEDATQFLDELSSSLRGGSSAEPFDVVIGAESLPGMPGATGVRVLDVLGALRQVGWATPVIVLAARLSEPLLRRVRHLGGATVLAEAIDPDLLVAEMDRAVDLGTRDHRIAMADTLRMASISASIDP